MRVIPAPPPYAADVRRALVLLTVLAAACNSAVAETPTSDAPRTPPTTAERATTTATTSSTTTTTTTIPLATVEVLTDDDVPRDVARAVTTVLDYAADDRNEPPPAPRGLVEHVSAVGALESVTLSEFSSADLADGSTVAVVSSSEDDIFLAVDDGSGWQVVGAHLASLGAEPWYGEEPLMVLILGSDARSGPGLTAHSDSIHVVTALPSQGTGSILGWPRDSYVPTPHGEMKITALMVVGGGPEATRDQFREYWELPISGYIVTAFKGFERLVGVLGSVLIDIPRALPTQEWFAGFSAGEQRLNPVRALDYVRTRKKIPGGDLTRSKNQGVMMLAVLRMIQLNGIETLPHLVAAITQHTTTDLTPAQLLQFGAAAFALDPDSIENQVLPGKVGRTRGASVVFLDPEADDIVADLREDGLLTPAEP